jgi:uncharacterized protein YjiS (DUF1127 family)
MSTSFSPDFANPKIGHARARNRSRLWADLRTLVAMTISAVQGWMSDLARQRRLRLLEDELARLDDRTLKDIGLDRSEIGPAIRWGRDI